MTTHLGSGVCGGGGGRGQICGLTRACTPARAYLPTLRTLTLEAGHACGACLTWKTLQQGQEVDYVYIYALHGRRLIQSLVLVEVLFKGTVDPPVNSVAMYM